MACSGSCSTIRAWARCSAAVKFIGDRLLRKEDPRLVQGRGRYVGDIALPGMLHAAIVRSPHAHARIVGIDASRALEAPGVAGVVTFADLGEAAARPFAIVPPHAALRGKNFCVLAGDPARFVGEAGVGGSGRQRAAPWGPGPSFCRRRPAPAPVPGPYAP